MFNLSLLKLVPVLIIGFLALEYLFDIKLTTLLAIIFMFLAIAAAAIKHHIKNLEKEAYLRMAKAKKREFEIKAESLSQNAPRELRKTPNERVIINHQLKTKLIKKLEQNGLKGEITESEAYELIFDEKATSFSDLNPSGQAFAEPPKDQEINNFTSKSDEGKNKSQDTADCEKRDSAGNCIINTSESAYELPKEEENKHKTNEEVREVVQYNPATGLPILPNGLDVLGNPLGFDLEKERQEAFSESERLNREIAEQRKAEEERRELERRLIEQSEMDREREQRRRFEDDNRLFAGVNNSAW